MIDTFDTTLAGFSCVLRDREALDTTRQEREDPWEKLYPGPDTLWLGNYKDVFFDGQASHLPPKFVAGKTHERVDDLNAAKEPILEDHSCGTKRVPLWTHYLEFGNRKTVHSADADADSIRRIAPTGVETKNRSFELDDLIFAARFDAYDAGVLTDLGVQITDFRNVFVLVGPQNGATLRTIPRCSAIVVEWLDGSFRKIRGRGARAVGQTHAAQKDDTEPCHKLLDLTPIGETNSWFTGFDQSLEREWREALVRIGGDPSHRALYGKIAQNGYEGFFFHGRASNDALRRAFP